MGSKHDREINEEIESHLRMAIQDRIDRGESPAEARAAVYRQFGNVGLVKETTRSVHTWTAIEQLLQDLRFGIRILWKSPGLSATAAILIALVIGGNTTIYSLVKAAMTRPAPGVTSKNLYYLWLNHTPSEPFHSYADYLDYASQGKALSPLFAFGPERATLTLKDGSYALMGAYVTANYFEGLGVRPVLGRTFREDDNRLESAGLVAIISHRVWQERFNGAENVVGRAMVLNGHNATIVGVAPPTFQGVDLGAPDDVWVPIASYFRIRGSAAALSDRSERGRAEVLVLGQLRDSASLARAQTEIATISSRLQMAFPESHKNRTSYLAPYTATANAGIQQVGPRFLAIFSVITILTLLIVCANVANLMLARAVSRQRETALRQSFGASRFRIIRMLAAEGLAIAGAAWAGACLFALWVSKAMGWLTFGATNRVGMRTNHRNMDFSPDWQALTYAMILAVLATLIISVAPSLHSWRRDLVPDLKAGEQGFPRGRSKLAAALVVMQLAFSVLLLTSAGLAYRSSALINTADPGFEKHNLLLVTVNPTLSVTDRQVNLTMLEQLRERLQRIPGVQTVSYVRLPPPFTWSREAIRISNAEEPVVARSNYVGPDYLRTLGLTPVLGRGFSAEDRMRGNKVALINQDLAQMLWPDQSPVGQTMLLGRKLERVEVIGVTPNASFSGFERGSRSMFVFLAEQQDPAPPIGQFGLIGSGETTFYLKCSGNLDAIRSNIGGAVKDVDTRIPIVYMRTMENQLDNFETHMIPLLLAVFSAISIMIAATGQYAVIAFEMRRRTREFGIRVAIGASSTQIMRSVLREGFTLTAVGLAAGFALSAAVGTALRGFLYGVTPTDGVTYLGVFSLLAVASLLACYLPARRASRIDPLVALRCD